MSREESTSTNYKRMAAERQRRFWEEHGQTEVTDLTKNLTFKDGTRPRKETMQAEKGKYPSVQRQNKDLERRLFGRLRSAVEREAEFEEEKLEIQSIPERIRGLAQTLSKIPFHKWSAQQLTEAQKYFNPAQMNVLIEASRRNTGTKL